MAGTEKGEKIDALSHELTGLSITFGDNTQHTIYTTVDHVEADTVKNITSEECRSVVETLPDDKFIVIHNRSFAASSSTCSTARGARPGPAPAGAGSFRTRSTW